MESQNVLIVGLGILMIFASFIWTGKVVFTITIAGVVIHLVTTVLYSYVVWKNDPDKQTVGR